MHALLLAAALSFDVLVSAGHEGRPESCARFPQHHCNLGAQGERDWTPIVADEAARVLRAHGVTVARLPADFDGSYDVGAAVFVHFDGSVPACGSGASIGFPPGDGASERAAAAWRSLYGAYFPYRWEPDDFTTGLRGYYGYKQVRATDGALVLELGELTCPAQRAWLEPRLRWEGQLLAYFLSGLIGKGDVPKPAPFASVPEARPQHA